MFLHFLEICNSSIQQFCFITLTSRGMLSDNSANRSLPGPPPHHRDRKSDASLGLAELGGSLPPAGGNSSALIGTTSHRYNPRSMHQ